jgi:hypothetical protein
MHKEIHWQAKYKKVNSLSHERTILIIFLSSRCGKYGHVVTINNVLL